ncbi:virulence RhuM family protein [Desulfovibrio sp. ZJ369]|uniref:virulence RhuM family protein n=1 Tax=Desulfovibrio sp. ZJ369 TaxID=2709793 RepID=UPI0013ED1D21|nr:virulence RhuM family protein [Desulfovibrio sp. ZJ369]
MVTEPFDCSPYKFPVPENIFANEELEQGATAENFSAVQTKGRRERPCQAFSRSTYFAPNPQWSPRQLFPKWKEFNFYSRNAIISVGCRVNSRWGTQFRIRYDILPDKGKISQAQACQGCREHQKRDTLQRINAILS